MTIQEKQDHYKEKLQLLEDNLDKYQYLIELGKNSNMPPEYRIDTFLVPGCISQLWLVPKYEDNVINFMSDSDAMITKGVATMVADIFSGATKEQISNIDMDAFIQGLQLTSILSQNRRNGAYNMFSKVKEYATSK